MAVEHQVGITEGPAEGQLPFLVFMPRLIGSSVSSLRAAISSGFHPTTKSTSTQL